MNAEGLGTLAAAVFNSSSDELKSTAKEALAARLGIFSTLQELHCRFWNPTTNRAQLCPRIFENLKSQMIQAEEILATDRMGQSAVHKAAAKGKVDVVAFLLGAKADINHLDKRGKSPLDLAEKAKDKAKMRFLGADGWTPLMIAASQGSRMVLDYLLYRDGLLCMKKRTRFSSQHDKALLFSENRECTWSSYEEASMQLSENGKRVKKVKSSPDYSCALGSAIFNDHGIYTWAIQVQNVESMWAGITDGGDSVQLGSSPDDFSGGALIAFHSDGGIVVVDCQPEFFNAEIEGEGTKLAKSEETGASDQAKNSNEEQENFDDDDDDDDEEEEEEEEENEIFKYKSGQILEFELDTVQGILKVTVDNVPVVLAKNVVKTDFRPFVCMDNSESATFVSLSWRASEASVAELGDDDKLHALDNSCWDDSADNLLLQVSKGKFLKTNIGF